MPSAGFKPVSQVIKQLQTCVLDCTASGISHCPAYIYCICQRGP